MTIYQIKLLTQSTSPYFFSPKTMKFFGQTLRSFKVYKHTDGKYFISAPMKDRSGRIVGYTERLFNPVTNELEFIPKVS